MKIGINFHKILDKGNNKREVAPKQIKTKVAQLKSALIEELLKNESEQVTKETKEKLVKYLKDMNVDDSKENMDTLKKIIKNEIPLSKELFKRVNNIRAKYNLIKDIKTNEGIKLPEELYKEEIDKIPLKKINELLSESSGKDNTLVKGNVKENVEENIPKEGPIKESIAEENVEKKNTSPEKNEIIKNNLNKKNDETEPMEKKTESSNEKPNNKEVVNKETKENFVLDKTTDKILFLIKNNLKVNLENLDKAKYIFKEEKISEDIKELIESIDDPKVKNIIKKFILSKSNMDEGQPIKDNVKKMYSLLEAIKDELSEKDSPAQREQVDKLLDTMKFLDKVNKEMYYMQVPLLIDDDIRNLEMYMEKKDGKKKSIEGKGISFTLETKNLGDITCQINVNDENMNLKFHVNDDEIMNKMKNKEDKLKNHLEDMDFENILIKYLVGIKKDEIVYLENKEINFVDVKV
ncbi:flagellar hook-length control protein FliK [Anaeromicrobium sediminis]|uniref:Flagellar hook-length control protein-like C-terminal domain-containing protein n=1 Tax=Anaeromicrobium sediminis TaxID=1478221 RepID=A0A267MRJ6_9FIRM|nr:flagellar hook-length control protein FliK [Anaeromicrobium sediminis]PAB61360.1 hypothetical protein CCE28_02720 [Anaeromicrobium sediminis]